MSSHGAPRPTVAQLREELAYLSELNDHAKEVYARIREYQALLRHKADDLDESKFVMERWRLAVKAASSLSEQDLVIKLPGSNHGT